MIKKLTKNSKLRRLEVLVDSIELLDELESHINIQIIENIIDCNCGLLHESVTTHAPILLNILELFNVAQGF
jgi:hypothetical protein